MSAADNIDHDYWAATAKRQAQAWRQAPVDIMSSTDSTETVTFNLTTGDIADLEALVSQLGGSIGDQFTRRYPNLFSRVSALVQRMGDAADADIVAETGREFLEESIERRFPRDPMPY